MQLWGYVCIYIGEGVNTFFSFRHRCKKATWSDSHMKSLIISESIRALTNSQNKFDSTVNLSHDHVTVGINYIHLLSLYKCHVIILFYICLTPFLPSCQVHDALTVSASVPDAVGHNNLFSPWIPAMPMTTLLSKYMRQYTTVLAGLASIVFYYN